MKKHLKTTAVLCLLTFCLTGCFPTGEPVSVDNGESSAPAVSAGTEENSSDVQQESSVPAELENVKFTTNTSFDYPAEAPIIKCKLRKFDVEQAKALLLAGKTISNEKITDSNAVFDTADGETLSVNTSGILYVPDSHLLDNEVEKRSKSLMQRTAAHNACDTVSYYQFPHIKDELEGFSSSDAIKRANELVTKFEIKNLGEPEVFAFTAEDCHSYDEEIVLSKEEEFYLIRYYTTYKGIPVSKAPNQIFDKEILQEVSRVNVILTKDKIVEFNCKDLFDDIEEIGSTQIKCSPDTALRKLHDYFEMKGKISFLIEYDKLGLTYVLSERNNKAREYTYKPLWCASGKKISTESGSSGEPYTTEKCVDTATGTVFDTRD